MKMHTDYSKVDMLSPHIELRVSIAHDILWTIVKAETDGAKRENQYN
jgi:hypothetical protein